MTDDFTDAPSSALAAPILPLAAASALAHVGPASGVQLDADQRDAVLMALRHRVSTITGQAGSGKTVTISAICAIYDKFDIPVFLAAPTGKAAKRLSEVTGREASTIHRLLKYGKEGRFYHGKDNPLPEGVFLIDEWSMVDVSLAYHLLSAIPARASVVLIGDDQQLPAVGAGAILRDILDHDLTPLTRLRQVHRNAGTLRRNCQAVLQGRVEKTCMVPDFEGGPPPWAIHRQCQTTDDVLKAVRSLHEQHLKKWGFDPIRDCQFLAPKHGGPIGTKALNRLLQHLYQKDLGVDVPLVAGEEESRPDFYANDKVIFGKNDYDLGLMNGSVGFVVDIAPKEMIVEFDGREYEIPKNKFGLLDLAYCFSVHRAQGSQFPCVVGICHRSAGFMLNRNLFYTLTTRAQKSTVILGDSQTIDDAVVKVEANRRRTLLGVWGGKV